MEDYKVKNGKVYDFFGNELETFYMRDVEYIRFIGCIFPKSRFFNMKAGIVALDSTKPYKITNECGWVVGYYESYLAASKDTGISPQNIKRLITGERKVYKGLKGEFNDQF